MKFFGLPNNYIALYCKTISGSDKITVLAGSILALRILYFIFFYLLHALSICLIYVSLMFFSLLPGDTISTLLSPGILLETRF